MALYGIDINTLPSHELTPAARGYILGKISEGRKPRELARSIGVPQSTISDTIQKSTIRTNQTSQHRVGRPRSYSDREERRIVIAARKYPTIRYANIKQEANVEISNETIRGILKKHYIFHWISKKRPFLTKQTAKVRLDWARARVSWTEEQWKNIMWSDECSVERGSGKKPVWIWGTPSQKWEKDFITEHRTGKEISVMHNGYSAGSYVEVLEDQLPEYYKPGMKFMQDNARIHTAKATKEFLEEHGVETIEWPPYSPDMNPIEHAWIHLKRLVYHVCPDIEYGPKNQTVREDLEYALQEAWLHISDELFDSLGRISAKERKAIVEKYARYKLSEPLDVPLPPPLESPIKALSGPVDAFLCEEEECSFISINRSVIGQHCNQAHDWKWKKEDSEHWKKVKAQTFFTGRFRRYFVVHAAEDHSIAVALGQGDKDSAAAIKREWSEARAKRKKELEIADEKVAKTDRTGWFNRTCWPEHLAQRNTKRLAHASRPPDRDERLLQQAMKVVDLAMEKSVAGLSTLAVETRRWLRSAKREEIDVRPMARLQNPESQNR
ncbi:hypothetical protein B0A49_13150, partial [Cryomyces minteri]